jgi:hypothetical protein
MIQDVFLQITCDFIIVSIAIGTNQMLFVDMQIFLTYEHVCDIRVEGGNIGVITKSMNDITKAIVDPTTHLIEESFVVGDMQWQVRYAILETNKKS